MTGLRGVIAGLLVRGTVLATNAAAACQRLQAQLRAGEVADDIEHLEPYGLSAHALEGAEVVTASIGGDASHQVVLIVADRRHRPTDLTAGEVCLYDDNGQRVHLTSSGVVIEASSISLGGTAGTSPVARVGDTVPRPADDQAWLDQVAAFCADVAVKLPKVTAPVPTPPVTVPTIATGSSVTESQ